MHCKEAHIHCKTCLTHISSPALPKMVLVVASLDPRVGPPPRVAGAPKAGWAGRSPNPGAGPEGAAAGAAGAAGAGAATGDCATEMH